MAYFRAKAGQKAGFRVMLKYFDIKKAFRYYIKQIDSKLPYVWFSRELKMKTFSRRRRPDWQRKPGTKAAVASRQK